MTTSSERVGDAVGRLDLPVGYTDPVLGLSSWPSLASDFVVTAAVGGGATLSVTLTLQAAALGPGPLESGDAAAARALDLSGRLARIYYQVAQPDMTVGLSTSLNQPAGGAPIPLPTDMAPIRAQASAAYTFAATSARLTSVAADPATTPTLADVVQHYGLDWTALATANALRPIEELIAGTQVAIPVFMVFKAGDSVTTACPEGFLPVNILGDPDNTALPLSVGVELAIPSRTITPDATLSLTAIAEANTVTPASLTRANAGTPALLRPGFVFRAQGVEVEVAETGDGADTTLDLVASTFAANGVPYDAVMVAGANADVTPGMFRDGVALALDRYIIQPGETLDVNGSGATTLDLIPLNVATVDLFPAGSPIFLAAPLTAEPLPTPLAEAARTYGVDPGDILRHNADAAVADGDHMIVPGLSNLGDVPRDLRIPYAIPAATALDAVAALFLAADPARTPGQGLVAANAALPATVAGGRTIMVAGQSLITQTGDSFDAVIARADPPVTLDQLADAIGTDPSALQGGGLLLCPAACLSGAATTPVQAGARYGLEPGLLLGANAAVPGLLLSGQTLVPTPGATSPTVTTVAGDSLNAVVRRFARLEVATTPADIARANPDLAFLRAGAELLLPPPPRTLSANFGSDGWTLPGVVFPLQAWVTLSRDPALVDPAFRGPPDTPGSAVADVTAIPARRDVGPQRQENGAVTLNAFAEALETAVVGLRVATGKVLSAERQAQPTDVWAVSFVTPGGITQVHITPPTEVPGVQTGPQPRSFALRPLSNRLESRSGLNIKLLDPQTGLYGPSEIRDYQGIDLEVWAKAFLADFDLFLTAAYAAPAYQSARNALEIALGAKKDLAGAVADGLSLVLDVPEDAEIGSDNWTAAREALRQQLLVKLSRAYATAAVIQFEAQVAAPVEAASSRLSGAGRILDVLAPPGDEDDSAPETWRKAQLGNAKTPLGSGSWPVTFLLSVPDEAQHRAVGLSLDYAVNELEFDIRPEVEGYDASSWLSFVRPLSQNPPAALSAELGSPVVPIPLRAYPPLAALVSQHADINSAPTTLDEAVRWSYVLVYQHQSSAQDQIRLEVEFNIAPLSARKMAVEDDLFGRLAQYAAIAPTLWPLLAGLADPAAGVSPPVVANAVQTYADLIRQVADAWTAHWGEAPASLSQAASEASPPPGTTELYDFVATLDSAEAAGTFSYTRLTLQRSPADGAMAWPTIVVIKTDGRRVPLTPAAPPAADADADVQVYDFPPGEVEAFSPLGFELTFAGLHIAHYQNALSRVWVERNARLLGPDGPATREAFVYRTPPLAFPEPLVPLIQVSARLDIGTWSATPATNPLNAVFTTILDGAPTGQVAVAIRYGYALAPGPDPIETYLPVGLRPSYAYDGVQPIIARVTEWDAENHPVSPGGLWAFGINLYSSLDQTLRRPLLILDRLVSPIAPPGDSGSPTG